MVDSEPNYVIIRFDVDRIPTDKVHGLEDELAKEGIVFDTGYDIDARRREWRLGHSLTRGPKPSTPGRNARQEGRGLEPNYDVGDILGIPLNDNGGRYGYARILIKKSPLIFVEFYKFVSRENPPLTDFDHADWILRIYTGDMGIVRDGSWRVIGHKPVHQMVMPKFWLRDPLDGKLYLIDDPVHQMGGVPTTVEEIRRLRAQKGVIFGHRAAVKVLVRELREARVL